MSHFFILKFIVVGFAIYAAAASGDDLKFDQQEADNRTTLRGLTIDTRLCMRDATANMLRLGSRDSTQIVAFTTQMCGGALVYFLTKQAHQSTEVANAYIQAMAYNELNRIPGLSGPETQSRPAAPDTRTPKTPPR